MDVIRYSDGVEGALNIDGVYGLREFIIGGAEVNALTLVGGAVFLN